MWNWFKSALCDDALFIASCINNALCNSSGPQLKRGCYWLHICKSFLVVLGLLTTLRSRSANHGKMKHITHGLMGGKTNICNEQHNYCGPSWIVHLCRPGLPMLLSWCEHFTTLKCVPKLASIFHPWGWILWIPTRRSKLCGWINVYYVKHKAMKVYTRC
jgi:hypothetical protein